MNDPGVKISYGKVAANLLITSVFYVVLLILAYFFLGAAFTAVYRALAPYLKPADLFLIVLLQFVSSLMIILYLLGALSAWMNSSLIRDRRSALLIGVLTGFCANVFPWIALFIYDIFNHIGNVNHYLSSQCMFWIYFLIFWMILFLLSAPLMALSAYGYERNAARTVGGIGQKTIPKYLMGATIVLALIILLPTIAVYLLYSLDVIAHSGVPQFSASRLDNSTITITFDGFAPEHYAQTDNALGLTFASGISRYTIDVSKPYDLQLLIHDKDASSAGAIEKSGLDASISPAGGLTLVKGSSVTLAGEDIRPIYYGYARGTGITIYCNGKDGKHIEVDDILVE